MNKWFMMLWSHFLTAMKSLGRHLAMTISSSSAVMVTLILMSLFLLLAGNVANFTTNVESSLKIHAAIDKVKTTKDIEKMQKDIENIDGIVHVVFSSKEDELNTLIKESGAVFSRYEKNNPMPNAFIIEVRDANVIPSVTATLNKVAGIEKAQYGGETINNLIDTFDAIRSGGTVFIVFLSILAIFLISNTIKMTIFTRNAEISIMRNVGASNWYIKLPFMIEGMFIGMLGAVFPMILTYFGYVLLYNSLGGQFLSSMLKLQAPFPFAVQICLILLACGAVVGMIGSFLSVSRYLRWKR